MKTNAYLLIVLASLLSVSANAQLRLLPSGRVQIGNFKENNEDLENVTNMSIFGNIGDARTGSKLSFGDFERYANQGWNVFLGEYGTTDTDQLWMHGKQGLYMTVNGFANKVVAYYDPAVNANFVFNTNLRVNGVNITSDMTKRIITKIGNIFCAEIDNQFKRYFQYIANDMKLYRESKS